MVFANAEEAAAARERLTKGLSFADLAKERGLQETDTDVGMVAKADIIDPAAAEAAFAMKSGDTSEPVKGQFGTLIMQVRQDRARHAKAYDQVATQIKRRTAEARAKTELGTRCATRSKTSAPPVRRSPKPPRNLIPSP